MDVRAPDGTVIENIPDGTTKEEIAQRLAGKYGFPDAEVSKDEYYGQMRDAVSNTEDVHRIKPMTMLKNTPESAVNLVKDTANVVMHPIDTATAVWNLAQGVADKAGLDINGKNEEIYADAVMKMIKQRYGSVDKFVNTLNTDPVGAFADIAGIVTGGSAAAAKLLGKTTKASKAANVIAKMGSTADPWNMIKSAGRTAVKKATKDGLPERWYEEVVKFSNTKYTPSQRSSLYKTGLDNRIEPTPKGVAKLGGLMDAIDTRIDDLIEAADGANTQVPVGKVLRNLQELKSDKGGFKFDAADDLAAIDGAVEQFNTMLDQMGMPATVTVRQLQNFKTDLYKGVNYNRKNQAGTRVGEDIRKNLARGAKESVEEIIPEVKDLNSKWGSLLELKDPLEKASGRIGNRNALGIQTPLAATAGGQVGGAEGAAITGALSFIFNPQNKAKLAIALHHIKVGNKSWLDNNLTAQEARYAALLAGRTEEELRDMGLLYEESQDAVQQ